MNTIEVIKSLCSVTDNLKHENVFKIGFSKEVAIDINRDNHILITVNVMNKHNTEWVEAMKVTAYTPLDAISFINAIKDVDLN